MEFKFQEAWLKNSRESGEFKERNSCFVWSFQRVKRENSSILFGMEIYQGGYDGGDKRRRRFNLVSLN